jgi:hypothetical protein
VRVGASKGGEREMLNPVGGGEVLEEDQTQRAILIESPGDYNAM